MADLALTVGLKGRDDLSRPLARAAQAARGLRGQAQGAGGGLARLAEGAKATGRGVRGLSGPMGQAARRIQELERVGGDIERFRALKTVARANATALAAARDKTEALGRALASGEARTTKATAAFKRARTTLTALEAKAGDHNRALADQRRILQAAGIATGDLAAAQRRLKGDLAQATAAAEGQARAFAQAAARAARLARMKEQLRGLAGVIGKAATAARGLAAGATRILAPLGALSGLASLAGVTRLVTGFARASDETAKFARQLGFTAEAVQELHYAAERQGVGQETFNASLGAFAKRLGELRAGKGALAGLLRGADPALGAQLAGATSAEAAFSTMLDALARVEDPQRRAALAAAAFGRSGMVMSRMAEAGADGLAALRQEARALGVVVDNDTAAASEGFVDSLTRLETAIDGLGKTIGAVLMPRFRPVIEALTRWIIANRDLIAARVEQLFTRIADAVRQIDFAALALRLKDIMAVLGAAVAAVGGWENALLAVGVVLNAGLIASVLRLGGGLIGLAQGGLPLLVAGFKMLTATALPLVITGFKALTAVVLANPIGLIIGGIALAAGLIITHWEPLAAWFSGLWGRIKQPLDVAWGWIKQALGWTPLGAVVANWEPLAAWFAGLWQRILAPFQAMMGFIEGKLDFLSGAVGRVSGLFDGIFGGDDDGDNDRQDHEPMGQSGPSDNTASRRPDARPFAIATPPPVGLTPAPLRQATAARPPPVMQTITINVTPPPGVDPQEVARLVMAALASAERGAKASRRGQLLDGAG